MKNVLYDFDPKTSLFEHHFPKESISSEINYILSVSEMLEALEYKHPKFFLIETDGYDLTTTTKLSAWITNHVLPQIARLGIRKMAIVAASMSEFSMREKPLHIFPWLKVASFASTESARKWLLESEIS